MNNKSFFIMIAVLIGSILTYISLYFDSLSGLFATIVMSFITVGYIVSDKLKNKMNSFF